MYTANVIRKEQGAERSVLQTNEQDEEKTIKLAAHIMWDKFKIMMNTAGIACHEKKKSYKNVELKKHNAICVAVPSVEDFEHYIIIIHRSLGRI